MKYLCILIGIIFFTGCSEDELNFIGNFESTSIRDECPDSNNNVQVNANNDGICLQQTNGIECIKIILNIESDGTFTMSEVISAEAFGSFLPVTTNDYSGTYTTSESVITLNRSSASTIMMNLDASETNLDWKISTTSAGCDRLYQFIKQL